MATKKDASRTRIETVKVNIRSISTCSTSTVAELQELLADKTEEPVEKENVRARRPQPSVQAGTRKKVAPANATTASLAPRERYILATEVANITLKSLADALKSQPPRKPSRPQPSKTDAPNSARSRPSYSRSSSLTQSPLKERSVSQATNSPIKPSSLRRSISLSSGLTAGPDPGLVATAECARVAFSYLRTPEAAKTAGKDTPALQLENGHLALIGKLVAHGLDNLAIKELRILRKRLDSFLGKGGVDRGDRTMSAKPGAKKTAAPAEKESIALLLDFGDIDRNSPALSLVVTHQTYTLRVVSRIRRPRLVEEAWGCLKLSNPSSPANLMWHVAKESNADPKMLRQLESLAQTVLALCPSISSSDDISADQAHLQPPPDLVFSLQHLAFKIRQRWWTLAKHQGNEEKELLEPFSRCLVAFARRSDLSPLKKYKVADLLFSDLLGSPDSLAAQQRKDSRSVSAASKTLSSLAQSANLAEEALRWISLSGSPTNSKESAAGTAIRLVRAGALSLDVFLKDTRKEDPDETVTNALEALSGSLGGSSSELDSLFMQVNALRRTAAKAISMCGQIPASAAQLQNLALRIISTTVHFSARYLGPCPEIDADSQAQVRHTQRARVMHKYLKSIIDSACMCSKLPIESDLEGHWATMDGLLQDCLAILQHFQGRSEDNLTFPDDLQQPYVKLSNAYWAAHAQLKASNGVITPSIQAMQRSVEVIQPRPQVEQESGLLTMKLERLSEALDSTGRVRSSREVLVQCIRTLIESGMLQDAIELSKENPVHHIFESNESTVTLGRALKTFHRSFLKSSTKDSSELAFFDDAELPLAGRGVILEWQLSLYLKALSRNRSWDSSLTTSVQAISQRLQDIYEPGQFPIRRRRVQIMLLQLSQEHPDILPEQAILSGTDIGSDFNEQNNQDHGLRRYQSHMDALWKLKNSIKEYIPSVAAFQECHSIWNTLLDSTTTWKDLSRRVDSIELWLADLQTAIDYLAAKGEEYTCIPMQHLLVRVLELEKNVDPSRLVTNLSTLGLQFLRLGYTGKAGLAFAKAETCISNENTSTEAKLQWHLGYAEYLLQIGNAVKW